MDEAISDVQLRPLSEDDLELLMSWRSHPKAYKFFKAQKKPLVWAEHLAFWSRRKNREDFLILFQDDGRWRKVGSVNISALDTESPEIGIIIGELTAHGKGLGSRAAVLALKHLIQMGYLKAKAVIHKDNTASKKLFTKLGFSPTKKDSHGDWNTYEKLL